MGDMIEAAEIGRKIKLYRQQSKLSQERLAEMVGVTFQQIQKYESGHTTLNVVKLQQISTALKISPANFFESSLVEGVRLTSQEDQLLLAFRQIKSSRLRDSVLDVVSNLIRRSR